MTIETDRLLLRPFQERDAEDVYEYLRKPSVHCFESMKVTSVEEAKRDMVRRSKDGDCTFAIVLKETGKVIGEIDAAPEESNYAPIICLPIPSGPVGCSMNPTRDMAMPMKPRMPFSIICSKKRRHVGFMPTLKTTILPANDSLKN